MTMIPRLASPLSVQAVAASRARCCVRQVWQIPRLSHSSVWVGRAPGHLGIDWTVPGGKISRGQYDVKMDVLLDPLPFLLADHGQVDLIHKVGQAHEIVPR